MRLMDRIRVRALWIAVGVITTAVGVIVWTTIPAWPIVGVAVATLVVAMNSLSSRISLSEQVCLGCGHSLAREPEGEHGVICPGCGQINQPAPMSLAKTDATRALDAIQRPVDKQA